MLVKCACQKCGENLEFDTEQAGAFVDCPHCSRQTRLLIPKPDLTPSTPVINRPVPITADRRPVPGANLTLCPDCSATISHRALMCPQCGCCVGIRFRLVWDVMCLVALITLIFAALGFLISALFAGAMMAIK